MLPFKRLARCMNSPVLLDARNFLSKEQLTKQGYRYLGMGR